MPKHKHQFHCQHCGSPCEIFKKGRAHRVLVCPHCGVLATNPTLAGSILRGAVGSIPVVGGALSGAVGHIQDKKDASRSQPPLTQISTSHGHLSAFEKALLLDALER